MNDMLSEKDNQTVQQILADELGVALEQLTPEARLVDDLGADSLTIVEITMRLEDEFDLSIPDERWESVRSVGDLHETLAGLLNMQRR